MAWRLCCTVGLPVRPFSHTVILTLLWKSMVQKRKGTDNSEEGLCLNLMESDIIYDNLFSGDKMESSHDYYCAVFLIF